MRTLGGIRRFLGMAAVAAVAALSLSAVAGPQPVAIDPEGGDRLSAEALARYEAPGAASRYAALTARLEQPVEELGPAANHLRLTLRSWPNGHPKTTLTAEEAWMTQDMMSMRGRKVVIRQLREDGSVEATLTAEEAVMDRTAMLAVAKGTVTCVMNQDRLEGEGAWADLDVQYVKVLSEGVIHTARLQGVALTERGMF